jgi:hypothetical protein
VSSSRGRPIVIKLTFFAFINALILAKILLIGEDLHLANRFRHKPLLYSIFYKCFVFMIFFIGVQILERVIEGVWSGRTIAQSFPDIGGGSLKGTGPWERPCLLR